MGSFEVVARDGGSAGRCGLLRTAHGEVETPAFMAVGTAGAVKGTTPEQLKATGADIILANTYHLMLRPGVEAVESLGGLHKFMAWDGPILTDSGGYQVFSLSSLVKVDDEGVEFASHVDGAKIRLNAENATQIQNRLGADVIMCFDECAPYPAEPGRLREVVERTIKWAKRCRQAHTNEQQMLFGIVQGGIDIELRSHCTDELARMDFDGFAIGGLSVGEGHENMIRTAQHTAKLLPAEKPRYLMGVGMPGDIIAAVKAGMDMFDCVLPTRNGRNAFAFTRGGAVRLRNSEHIDSGEPIEARCDCYCCRNFSRGTIRHFFNCGEMLGPILASLHNLRYYQRLMAEIRARIKADEFSDWAEKELKIDY